MAASGDIPFPADYILAGYAEFVSQIRRIIPESAYIVWGKNSYDEFLKLRRIYVAHKWFRTGVGICKKGASKCKGIFVEEYENLDRLPEIELKTGSPF